MLCGRMLFTRTSLFADQSVACIAIIAPPPYETFIKYVLMCFELAVAVVGFVCFDCCPAVFPWSCIPGTVVRGLIPVKSALQQFTFARTENCPALTTP